MGNPHLLLIHRFTDERLKVYVVLRITNASEEALKEFLPRLAIKLDIHAVNDFPIKSDQSESGNHEGPERDLIFSRHIEDDKDPFIAVNADQEISDDDDDEPTILAIWELEVVLNRPRIRFPNPALTFTASASLPPARLVDDSASDDEYVPSLVPAPTNILERLKTIPALKDRAPYLPASRIESVLPAPQLDSETLHIRHQPKKCIPISPAVSARIRCSHLNTTSPLPTTVASLDFEVTPFATFDVLLNHANVSLTSDGRIELLSPLKMPIRCRPRDTITFLYKVQATSTLTENLLPLPAASPNPVGLLDILLECTLQISKTCTPKITMRWRSNVDFSYPPDARSGPSSYGPQRLNRVNSLAFPANPLHPTTASINSRPTSITTTTTTNHLPPLSSFAGLTLSITSPAHPIPLGHIFTYTLLLTNHSPRPLKLALIPIPHRRPTFPTLPYPRGHAPKHSASSSSSAMDRRHTSTSTSHPPVTQNPQPSNSTASGSGSGSGSAPLVTDIAPAITDENILHVLQRASLTNPSSFSSSSSAGGETDLIPLSTDVRLGQLGPGSCHEVHLKMLGLRVGVVGLERVRVVDLGRETEGNLMGVGDFWDVGAGMVPEVLVVDEREGRSRSRSPSASGSGSGSGEN